MLKRLLQTCAHVAAQSEVSFATASERVNENINLHNFRFRQHKLFIWKVHAGQEKQIAFAHRAIPRAVTEQASHGYVVWIIKFDELLVFVGVTD